MNEDFEQKATKETERGRFLRSLRLLLWNSESPGVGDRVMNQFEQKATKETKHEGKDLRSLRLLPWNSNSLICPGEHHPVDAVHQL